MARLRDLLRSAGWREFVLLLAVAAVCGGILTFVGVTDLVSENELHETEIRLMRDLRSAEDPSRPIGPPWLERWSREITSLGGGAVLSLMTSLVVGYLLIERLYASAVLILVSVGGGTLLTAVSFLVGLSRVYLGVHYPTDVVARWAGGTAWALLCWLTAYWLEKRGKVEPERR